MVKITKRGSRAWITFTVSGEGFERVDIKGAWSGWEREPMKRKKSGEFYIVKVLPVGSEFQFGYLGDGENWIYDDTLPSVESPFGSRNSILKI